MAKQGKKKISRKYLANAANLKREARHKFIVLAISVVVAIAVVLVWNYIRTNVILEWDTASSLAVFVFFFIVVIIVGIYGNAWSRAMTEYNKYKRMYDLSEEAVKEFMKNNK